MGRFQSAQYEINLRYLGVNVHFDRHLNVKTSRNYGGMTLVYRYMTLDEWADPLAVEAVMSDSLISDRRNLSDCR